MINFISPSDRKRLIDRFRMLTPQSEPVFGLMTSQHMVEHVCITFSLSNGRREIAQSTPERLANITKRRLLESEMTFPKGFKAPILPENDTLPYQYESLNAAIEALADEIDAFERWFEQHPDSKPVHPVMGPLSYKEWQVFHSKHILHHLEQFGL